MTKIYAKYSSEGKRLWWKRWNKLWNRPNKQRKHERVLHFYCWPKIGKYKIYNKIRQTNLQVLSKEKGVEGSKRRTFSHCKTFRKGLCSSAKWLPEREKSWFMQIDIDSITAKNIVYTPSLSKCPVNERVPVTSLFIFMRKNQVKALLQNVNSWPMHIPKSWVLELFFQVINCPVIKMSC